MDSSYNKTCQGCCCARNHIGNSQEWVTSSTPYHSWKNHMLPCLEFGNREIWQKDVKVSLMKFTLFPGEKVVINAKNPFQGIKSLEIGTCCKNSCSWSVMSLLFWVQNPVAVGGKKASYFKYSLCMNTEILFFLNIINSSFIIYVTGTVLICMKTQLKISLFGSLAWWLEIDDL